MEDAEETGEVVGEVIMEEASKVILQEVPVELTKTKLFDTKKQDTHFLTSTATNTTALPKMK